HDPTFFKTLIDDGALDALDRHRRLIDAQHARTLARRRADAAGEFGEVVRLVQPIQRLAPQSTVNEIVPFGDQVVDGTAGGHAFDERAGVAERHAAIHATGALGAQLLLVGVLVELSPVVYALCRMPHQR